MSATASTWFYFSDWQGASDLRCCSMAAQGYWMRLLCIAFESKEKGFVLVNGRAPTWDELSRIIGIPAAECQAYDQELDRNGVLSIDRRGVRYCRRMVKEDKRQQASRKGGKKGGRVTHEKQRGIFSTQGPTQGGTQDATQHPRHARAQVPSHNPIEERDKPSDTGALDPHEDEDASSLDQSGDGTGDRDELAAHDPDHVTIEDPDQRIARFQQKLAAALGPDGLKIIYIAMDPTHAAHALNLSICKACARTKLNRGWPHKWPLIPGYASRDGPERPKSWTQVQQEKAAAKAAAKATANDQVTTPSTARKG